MLDQFVLVSNICYMFFADSRFRNI